MMLKNALVFIHLIAMAVAVGKILEFDLRFILFQARAPLTREAQQSLQLTKTVVAAALAILWVTGMALVVQGALTIPGYLDNQKLWVKAFVVACLTVNGWVLHHWAFPILQGNTAFFSLRTPVMIGLAVLATASSVSWLYASFLGIARFWNHNVLYSVPIAVYLVLLMGGWTVATFGVLWLSKRGRQLDPERERSPCVQN